jgi:hypothetical protein
VYNKLYLLPEDEPSGRRHKNLKIKILIYKWCILLVYIVKSYVNRNNTLEEEIKERIIAGNKAFYANRKMFESKPLSRKSKLKCTEH